MTDKTMSYDHPHYITHRHKFVKCDVVATAIINTTVPFPHGGVVKALTAGVTIAGTNDVAGWGVYNGTTSVGIVTVGTNAALSVVAGTLAEFTVADNSYIEFRNLATSNTLKGTIDIEWVPTVGSNVTA